MKFSSRTLLIASTLFSAHAFVVQPHANAALRTAGASFKIFASGAQSEVEALRAAAAKAREEADRLAKVRTFEGAVVI